MAYTPDASKDAAIVRRFRQIYDQKIKDNRYTGGAMMRLSEMKAKQMTGAGSGRGKKLRRKGPMAGYHGAGSNVRSSKRMVRRKLNQRMKHGASVVPGGAALIGGRKKRKASKWNKYFAKFYREHPEMRAADAMKAAAVEYRKCKHVL